MIHLRNLGAACAVAGCLALPAAAAAMPIDNGRVVPSRTVSAAPPAHVVIQSADETLPIALAGAALLVAMSTAGYSALRLAPPRAAPEET